MRLNLPNLPFRGALLGLGWRRREHLSMFSNYATKSYKLIKRSMLPTNDCMDKIHRTPRLAQGAECVMATRLQCSTRECWCRWMPPTGCHRD